MTQIRDNIKIKMETKTPLWTGDVNGNCEKLKLTGIMGSLRWWFEALVRGMGYYACDTTSDKSCKVEIKNPQDVFKIYEKICPICFFFGTTGWKSRFSVSVENDNLKEPYNGKVVVNINGGKDWHYETGLMGNATLNLKNDEFYLNDNLEFSDVFQSIIKILLYLIQEYGMLGAKTSMGYGVVRFKFNGDELSVENSDWKNFEKYLKLFENRFNPEQINDNERKRKIENNLKNFPNLKDMFFVKFSVNNSFNNILQNIKSFYRLKDGILKGDIDKLKYSGWVISSPIVRKEIRAKIKSDFPHENNLRHFLMGKVKDKNSTFSAIQVSHVYYNGENLDFRIYGWLPDKYPINGRVQNILELLTQLFNDVPWKAILPSQIQNGICWKSGSLELLNSEENIRELSFKQGEHQ